MQHEHNSKKKQQFIVRSEPDYFGFSYQLAAAIGSYSSVPFSRTTLAHGWNPFRPRLPERYFHTNERVKLVQNQKIAQYLNDNGYEAYSVGIPFINYINFSSTQHERISDSVLIVMRHSHPHFNYSPSKSFDSILKYCKKTFKNISILAPKSDFKKYQSLFGQEPGEKIYLGADVGDMDSFPRLAKAFSENEYMVSSSWGSHLLYGAACGMRVGIMLSAFEEYQPGDFAQNPWYKKHPKLVDEILNDYSIEGISELCQEILFTEVPRVGVTHELIRTHLNHIDKNIHASLLGWTCHKKHSALRCCKYFSEIFQIKKLLQFKIQDYVNKVR
jgi:hypothetical protein